MPDPRELQEIDGVELPRMSGDSADQIFDNDTMDVESGENQNGERRGGNGGGSGGLSGGAGQVTGTLF